MQRRISELREACTREIDAYRHRSSLAADSFRRSLVSLRSAARETLAQRKKLGKLKEYLDELETDLEQALSVKVSKESRHAVTVDSLSAIEARIEELKEIGSDQRARRDEFAAIVTQQKRVLEVFEEKCNQEQSDRKNLEEAVMWYNRVLGFRTEGGEGVKFIFNKIDAQNPDNEYSFTIRLNGDVYALLHCDPLVEDLDELIKDLNKTNALFKFVRIMREKFHAAALIGISPTTTSVSSYPVTSSVTISSVLSTSVDSRSETLTKSNDQQPQERQLDASQGVISGQICTQTTPSPRTLSNLFLSPLFRTKKSV